MYLLLKHDNHTVNTLIIKVKRLNINKPFIPKYKSPAVFIKLSIWKCQQVSNSFHNSLFPKQHHDEPYVLKLIFSTFFLRAWLTLMFQAIKFNSTIRLINYQGHSTHLDSSQLISTWSIHTAILITFLIPEIIFSL